MFFLHEKGLWGITLKTYCDQRLSLEIVLEGGIHEERQVGLCKNISKHSWFFTFHCVVLQIEQKTLRTTFMQHLKHNMLTIVL